MNEHRELWLPSPTVELGGVVRVTPDRGFETVHGGRLEQFQVSYETWGTLNEARDNAVLLVHPLASDCHATGDFDGQPLGWWEPLVGPGRAIDTERFFVVCPNLLGGCFGTTGPRFPAPDGEPYLDRFPLLTPLDMMRAQRLFLREMGIERLHMVIGPSMGGMIAWEWAIEAGEEVDRVVVVAAPLRTTALQVGLNWLQRRGIELDLGGDEVAARAGQMIARGIGMLSYRSGIGLEEKFGRDWFKKPGGTLKDRGMFNVESWLRHHGKRSVKRMDPYTYLLFSRAMDLHDVGEDRDGFVNALDRVRCQVLVIGISSDLLYPASEVRLGADILEHLGRDVVYDEIRSPHGHDAFLLEFDQLTEILGARPFRQPTLVTPGPDAVQTARLGVLGAGKVAALLLRLIEERREQLRSDFDLRLDVAAVGEIDRDKQLDAVFGSLDVTHDPAKLVERDDVDVIVDLTRGAGSLELVERALERGRPVVTPNKVLIRRHGPLLEQKALDSGVRLAYHNSIAAGWPLLYTVERPLGREQVGSIRSLLSSTCNVVMERIEQGIDLDEAVALARSEGLTEPDPELDISGWDTAQKLAILVARSRGVRYPSGSVPSRGLDDVDPLLIRRAPAMGFRIKLVGLFISAGESRILGVMPAAVTSEGHLGDVHGPNNVVVLEGESFGEMVFLGRGTGHLPVASAVLRDVVGIFRPAQSWTGRYPLAARSPEAPVFARHLARDGDSISVTETADSGTIPLLDSVIQPRPT